jgi:DUF917 family protein
MESQVLRTREDIEDLLRGQCFMATGGGGRPTQGRKLLLQQLGKGRELGWVDADTLPGDTWTATVAEMSGRVFQGGTDEELAKLGCVREKYDNLGLMVAAVRALEESSGVRIEAIIPGEMGASNVPNAMAAAAELGIPVVDGDYVGGRAVPEVSMTIPEISGVPIYPFAFVTRWGDVLILKETISSAMADRIGRMINLASYGMMGIAFYLLRLSEARKVFGAGTMTEAQRVGHAIREAREGDSDPVQAAVEAVDGWLLFQGEIVASEVADEQSYGFGVGTHTLMGLGRFDGHSFKLWYKNEYHVSWLDGKPFVTSPDCMIMVHSSTCEPALSFDFSVGDHVAVIGRTAYKLHRAKEGIAALGPRRFGFDLDYVAIETRVKDTGL